MYDGRFEGREKGVIIQPHVMPRCPGAQVPKRQYGVCPPCTEYGATVVRSIRKLGSAVYCSFAPLQRTAWAPARNTVSPRIRHAARFERTEAPRARSSPLLRSFARSSRESPVDEETLPRYHPDHFYPVHIGDVFNSRYQVTGKLGFGGSSTS